MDNKTPLSPPPLPQSFEHSTEDDIPKGPSSPSPPLPPPGANIHDGALPPPPPFPTDQRPLPSDWKSIMLRMIAEGKDPSPTPSPRYPMFFYGSLMDPEVLQTIAHLPNPPQMRPATVTGCSLKLWDIYPALVRDPEGTVAGMVWDGATAVQFEKLAAYETEAYTWCECDVVFEDGTTKRCRTFCWGGEMDSEELEEAPGDKFDLEAWQRDYKPHVFGH
ncbi:hypothetical protein M011DRAFT_464624 [Sporormia fimetaria CBS 119925]|uniref:Putative gamma-glutamylcyclotransferase n=1 Tax=Sporormia fimetaria CBS 119925 TaxID=1340428 RepID=A0A6A6VJP6_9PLEO|nr:hypothetical protein M011DRAFT_464624 [Sporormia fimetaria CBS 119925]